MPRICMSTASPSLRSTAAGRSGVRRSAMASTPNQATRSARTHRSVLVATPDHWHAKISIDALESGKDVYCERPMTHTVEQALQLRNTVRRTGRVLQVGPNATASDSYWVGHQAIRAGRIGKVTWAHGSYNRNARTCLFNTHQKIDPTAGPGKSGEDYIDWDMWLGHQWGLAPKIE